MNAANQEGKANLNFWLICLALLAGTVLLYWPFRTHDFVDLDDPDYVMENPHVWRGLCR